MASFLYYLYNENNQYKSFKNNFIDILHWQYNMFAFAKFFFFQMNFSNLLKITILGKIVNK